MISVYWRVKNAESSSFEAEEEISELTELLRYGQYGQVDADGVRR